MSMRKKVRGFTLVEMLVVIGIIAILVTILVPVVRGVREKAKEAAVQEYCASLESALANYATSHGGNYPGVALDVMAPVPNMALGNPDFYAGTYPTPGFVAAGVIGGKGTMDQVTMSVQEHLKQVKDTPLNMASMATERYFDSLIASDSLQSYPRNPFRAAGVPGGNLMINIFRFHVADTDTPDTVVPYLVATPGAGAWPTDVRFPGRVLISDADPLDGNDYDVYFRQGACFAEGDFAYVPILTLSAFPRVDNPQTLENDSYRWGTQVTGYLLFGYGWYESKTQRFEKEKAEFGRTGLPGFGSDTGGPAQAPAVDTPYEAAVYALFNGAVFYTRH